MRSEADRVRQEVDRAYRLYLDIRRRILLWCDFGLAGSIGLIVLIPKRDLWKNNPEPTGVEPIIGISRICAFLP